MKIKIQLLPYYRDLPFPNDGSVLDLLMANDDFVFHCDKGSEIYTGMMLSIPKNYCGVVVPIRDLIHTHGITLVGAPYIIDSNYKKEITVICMNHSGKGLTLTRGMKIAQMVLVETKEMRFIQCSES